MKVNGISMNRMWRKVLNIAFVCSAWVFSTELILAQEYDESGERVEVVEELPERTVEFRISSRGPQNESIPFFLRTPKGYVEGDQEVRRLLFLCPYIHQTGINRLNQCVDFLELADERGWFVLSCTFRMQANWARDRKRSYYYPEGFSGNALVKALDHVGREVRIDKNRIFMQGLSAGAQFVHRFAMWAPDRVDAVVVNSSSWFDSPDERSGQVAWMLVIGETDPAFAASLQLSKELREVGVAPLFYPYTGEAHQGGGEVVEDLTVEWLRFQDDRTKHLLGKRVSRLDDPRNQLAMGVREMPYVGDAQLRTYREMTRENVEEVPADWLVFLPSKEVAEKWGRYVGAGGEE